MQSASSAIMAQAGLPSQAAREGRSARGRAAPARRAGLSSVDNRAEDVECGGRTPTSIGAWERSWGGSPMTRKACVTLLAVALWAGGFVSEATAVGPCNPSVCSEEIATGCAGLEGGAFRACQKAVVDDSKTTGCSCPDPTLPACGTTTTTTTTATSTTATSTTATSTTATSTTPTTSTTTIFGTTTTTSTTTTTTIPACTFLLKWGFPSGSGNGELSRPNGVATDASGNVYVADSGNDRIQKFDASGTFLTTWGSSGSGDGPFIFPNGVATDASGNVYVAD